MDLLDTYSSHLLVTVALSLLHTHCTSLHRALNLLSCVLTSAPIMAFPNCPHATATAICFVRETLYTVQEGGLFTPENLVQ
jgi:hypothetical protein